MAERSCEITGRVSIVCDEGVPTLPTNIDEILGEKLKEYFKENKLDRDRDCIAFGVESTEIYIPDNDIEDSCLEVEVYYAFDQDYGIERDYNEQYGRWENGVEDIEESIDKAYEMMREVSDVFEKAGYEVLDSDVVEHSIESEDLVLENYKDKQNEERYSYGRD